MSKEVEKVWEEFWKPIVTQDGAISLNQIKKELYDFYNMMEEVGVAYDYVTGGVISKPNTAAVHVIAAFDEYVESTIEEAVEEALTDYDSLRPFPADIDMI